MRSGVIAKGGSSPTELALAMRESFLVGKRVEGMRDGYWGNRWLDVLQLPPQEGSLCKSLISLKKLFYRNLLSH